jgi:hypothetical protein
MKVKFEVEFNGHLTSLRFNYMELHIRSGVEGKVPLKLLIEGKKICGCFDFDNKKIKILGSLSEFWKNFKEALSRFKYLKKFT